MGTSTPKHSEHLFPGVSLIPLLVFIPVSEHLSVSVAHTVTALLWDEKLRQREAEAMPEMKAHNAFWTRHMRWVSSLVHPLSPTNWVAVARLPMLHGPRGLGPTRPRHHHTFLRAGRSRGSSVSAKVLKKWASQWIFLTLDGVAVFAHKFLFPV